MNEVEVRFHEGLDKLIPRRKQRARYVVSITDHPSAKHLIESLGVPHTEIGRLTINEQPTGLEVLVRNGDIVDVYPVPRTPLQTEARFVLDTHLGKLATYLRMLGFDAVYSNDADDEALANVSSRENRILLTRDRGLLKRKEVVQGLCIREDAPEKQIAGVIRHFQLQKAIHPFERCLRCNSLLREVEKEAVADRLPPQSREFYDEFRICPGCGQIYWKGSHYQRMLNFIKDLYVSLDG